jgi:hypothetical protein
MRSDGCRGLGGEGLAKNDALVVIMLAKSTQMAWKRIGIMGGLSDCLYRHAIRSSLINAG